MNDQPKVEWHNGYEFHDMAEALAIRTKQILGAKIGDGEVIVVFTPEMDEDDLDPGTPVYVARLTPDDDRILRVVGGPILTEFKWADMEAEIKEAIDKALDDDA